MRRENEKLIRIEQERLAKVQQEEAEAKALAQQEQERLAKAQREEAKAKALAQQEKERLAKAQQAEAEAKAAIQEEAVKEVITRVDAEAQATKTISELEAINISIKEALKVVADAQKVLNNLDGDMKHKVKAFKELKRKESAAKSWIELKLKTQGENCEKEQLDTLFKEFKNCSMLYEDNKNVYEDFNFLINGCIGKCSLIRRIIFRTYKV